MERLAFHPGEPWLPENFNPALLSEDEMKIYSALFFHQGAEAAITVEALSAEAFPFREVPARMRQTREIIKALTENRKIAIATSIRRPYGFYLVVRPKELLEYAPNLTARAMSMLRRVASLKKVSLPVFLGQLSADLEGQ